MVTDANWRPKRQALAGPSNDERPENLIARTFREIGALSERFMRGTHAKGKMIFLPLTTRINVGSDRRQGGRFDAEERPVGQARPQRAQDWRQQTLHPAGSNSASSSWRRGNSLLENFPDAREIFTGSRRVNRIHATGWPDPTGQVSASVALSSCKRMIETVRGATN